VDEGYGRRRVPVGPGPAPGRAHARRRRGQCGARARHDGRLGVVAGPRRRHRHGLRRAWRRRAPGARPARAVGAPVRRSAARVRVAPLDDADLPAADPVDGVDVACRISTGRRRLGEDVDVRREPRRPAPPPALDDARLCAGGRARRASRSRRRRQGGARAVEQRRVGGSVDTRGEELLASVDVRDGRGRPRRGRARRAEGSVREVDGEASRWLNPSPLPRCPPRRRLSSASLEALGHSSLSLSLRDFILSYLLVTQRHCRA
ncbi:uncharacterized protein RHOBADRAFT_66502, partial [Rhodotorula graminis WP1]